MSIFCLYRKTLLVKLHTSLVFLVEIKLDFAFTNRRYLEDLVLTDKVVNYAVVHLCCCLNPLFNVLDCVDSRVVFPDVDMLPQRIVTLELVLESNLDLVSRVEHHLLSEIWVEKPASNLVVPLV